MEKKLMFNAILDLCLKQDLDVFERAKLLQKYLKLEGISARQLATKLNMSHSTLSDWLLWKNITPKEKLDLNREGYTDTEIYKQLRKKGKFTIQSCKFNTVAKQCNTNLRTYLHKTSFDNESEELVKEIINTCNRLLMRIGKVYK